MKFLVDEAISPKIVRLLRELGFEATRPKEFDMLGATDSKLAEISLERNFTIITLDMMFAYKFYFVNRGKLGFILLRLEEPTTENIASSLKSFLKSINLAEAEKKLFILREKEFEIIE